MENEEFEKLVISALDEIPSYFREKLQNVEVVVEDFPSYHQIGKLRTKGVHGLLLGLYEGIPQTRRRHYGIGGTLPDKISIFKIPILTVARSPFAIKNLVKETVVHEIAHHFGIDDDQLSQIEKENSNRV